MNQRFPLRVKAVMIDLDGTLADTVPDLTAAAGRMLRELGRPGLDREMIRAFVGKGIPRLVERCLAGSLEGGAPGGLMARALAVFERCYAEVNGRHSVVYAGVAEGLQALRAMRLPLACVTYGYNEGRDVRGLDVDAIVATLIEATRLIQKA